MRKIISYEKEAVVVRQIYKLFLEGKTLSGIAKGTVEKVVLNFDEKITFVFKDGRELEWNIY